LWLLLLYVIVFFVLGFGISFFYLNNTSDGIKNKRFFFFQDGDENAVDGNGEEQQGPQRTKKV